MAFSKIRNKPQNIHFLPFFVLLSVFSKMSENYEHWLGLGVNGTDTTLNMMHASGEKIWWNFASVKHTPRLIQGVNMLLCSNFWTRAKSQPSNLQFCSVWNHSVLSRYILVVPKTVLWRSTVFCSDFYLSLYRMEILTRHRDFNELKLGNFKGGHMDALTYNWKKVSSMTTRHTWKLNNQSYNTIRFLTCPNTLTTRWGLFCH